MDQACAKVILSGEHAVVYGGPALVCGIDLGVTAVAEAAREPQLVIEERPCSPETDTARAFAALLELLALGPCRVHLKLNMPVGVGLGASAAMAVASARAVARHFGRSLADAEVLAAADAWERIFHGNPSGVDAAAAHFGGCLRYDRTSGAQPLALVEDLTLLVAVAGPPSATKQMVERVASHRERDLPAFTTQLAKIAELTSEMQRCVLTSELKALGTAFTQNHQVLAGWGLSTPEIERCREVARGARALGSKLTGAGGGGCVVAVAEPGTEASVLQAWQDAGFRALTAQVRATGVQ